MQPEERETIKRRKTRSRQRRGSWVWQTAHSFFFELMKLLKQSRRDQLMLRSAAALSTPVSGRPPLIREPFCYRRQADERWNPYTTLLIWICVCTWTVGITVCKAVSDRTAPLFPPLFHLNWSIFLQSNMWHVIEHWASLQFNNGTFHFTFWWEQLWVNFI